MPLLRWGNIILAGEPNNRAMVHLMDARPPLPHIRMIIAAFGVHSFARGAPPPENPPRTHYSTRRARVFDYLPQQLRDFGKEPEGVVPTVGEQTHRDPLVLAAHADLASRPTIVRQCTNPFDELVLRRHLRPP